MHKVDTLSVALAVVLAAPSDHVTLAASPKCDIVAASLLVSSLNPTVWANSKKWGRNLVVHLNGGDLL